MVDILIGALLISSPFIMMGILCLRSGNGREFFFAILMTIVVSSVMAAGVMVITKGLQSLG